MYPIEREWESIQLRGNGNLPSQEKWESVQEKGMGTYPIKRIGICATEEWESV